MARRIFITVAEVSGDQHASQLAQSLRQLDPNIILEGHGGPQMRAAGVHIHTETTGRAAMGLRAIARAGEMWRLLQWTKRHIFQANPPDLHICVDSPATNFSFAKAAHECGVKVLYYIPPQLWAWRIQERRMKKLRRFTDQVACILPFEEQYFRQNGVNATYVGHPLFDELPTDRGPQPEHKYPNRPPIIGLLTGSRRNEAVNNFPHILDVARQVRAAFPKTTFLIPTTAATDAVVRQILARDNTGPDPLPLTVEQAAFDRMVPQCDLCLTKSGTSALHVAGYGVPMIVVFRASRAAWHLLARWLIKARTYSLVNVLADSPQHIAPEFIPWFGSNQPVAACAIDLLQHPEKLPEQRRRLLHVIQALDRPGASMNCAKLAMSMIDKELPSPAPLLIGK